MYYILINSCIVYSFETRAEGFNSLQNIRLKPDESAYLYEVKNNRLYLIGVR